MHKDLGELYNLTLLARASGEIQARRRTWGDSKKVQHSSPEHFVLRYSVFSFNVFTVENTNIFGRVIGESTSLLCEILTIKSLFTDCACFNFHVNKMPKSRAGKLENHKQKYCCKYTPQRINQITIRNKLMMNCSKPLCKVGNLSLWLTLVVGNCIYFLENNNG